MNLYLISQTLREWRTYDSAVVVAKDEATARRMQPAAKARKLGAWPAPENVNVEWIGVAREGLKGVVCASFNAG